MTFNDFSIHADIKAAIEDMGFKQPTPIQEQAIPFILENQDMIACAQTGTGKTAAYLIPLMHKLIDKDLRGRGINTLVIAPTRELAIQIDQNLEGLAYHTGISSLAIYGGGDSDSWVKGKRALQMEVDIIIATPGRLISHLRMGHLKLENLKHLVLDEGDRMLDMGFFEDIMDIIQYLPKNRQNLLFSATMPPEIRRLSKRILHQPKEINIAPSKPAEGILEAMYQVEEKDKLDLLNRLMKDKQDLKSVLIFSSTRRSVKEIGIKLQKLGLSAKSIHADLTQAERLEILRLFKNKRLRILVATDLMSRGIDVDGIDLVVNYTVPGDPEDYIHRIGRTARAESTGVALTFVSKQDARSFTRIERFLDKKIFRMPDSTN